MVDETTLTLNPHSLDGERNGSIAAIGDLMVAHEPGETVRHVLSKLQRNSRGRRPDFIVCLGLYLESSVWILVSVAKENQSLSCPSLIIDH